MRRQDEIAWIRRFRDHAGEASPPLESPLLRVPASHYTSPEHLELERQRLFRRRAGVVALSADLPGHGSFLPCEMGGIPILLTRDEAGCAHAFVNACRHRGSPLASARGCAAGGMLRCPFHAWSYSMDGQLRAIPLAEAAFRELEDAERNLLKRPCLESHGLVLVRAEGDAPIDPEETLAGLDADLEALHLGNHEHFDTHVAEWECNWKLLLDTFLESYHVFSLHRQSVDPWYLSLPMFFDAFGPNLRFPVATRSLLEHAKQPQDQWSLWDHATLQWLISPNALLTSTRHSSLLWRFEPLGASRTRVVTSLYAKRRDGAPLRPERLADEFALQLRVTAEEDFPQQVAVQNSLSSGALSQVVMGRHEGAVIYFHKALAQLLDSRENS